MSYPDEIADWMEENGVGVKELIDLIEERRGIFSTSSSLKRAA
jgi:cell division protein FtsI/penicillin-binding protein 2